jgi:hypothetical protein
MSEKVKTNYLTPLGTFRGEFDHNAVDPTWIFIHDLRVKNGIGIDELSRVVECGSSTISKGERGGHVSIAVVRKVLQAFGYDLKIVPKEEMNDV